MKPVKIAATVEGHEVEKHLACFPQVIMQRIMHVTP